MVQYSSTTISQRDDGIGGVTCGQAVVARLSTIPEGSTVSLCDHAAEWNDTNRPSVELGTKAKEALADKRLIYVMPFFNRVDQDQTRGWSTLRTAVEYHRYLGRWPDVVLRNKVGDNTSGVDVKAHRQEWVRPSPSSEWADQIRGVSGDQCSLQW